MNDPVVEILKKRLLELEKEFHQLQSQLDFHRLKQWEIEANIELKEKELSRLYSHLIDLQREEAFVG